MLSTHYHDIFDNRRQAGNRTALRVWLPWPSGQRGRQSAHSRLSCREHHSYEEERAKRKAGLSTGAELAETREGLWPLSATHDRDRSRERPRFRIF